MSKPKKTPTTLDVPASIGVGSQVVTTAPKPGQSYEDWHAEMAPKLLEIGTKIVDKLNQSIDKLPPAFLMQYIQQIQAFAGKPAGPSTVHNHQHLHIGRSKEELLAILQRKAGRSEPKKVLPAKPA